MPGGAASITTLLDAQSAALTPSESAANAVHDFLLELMRVERAMGTFGALQTDEYRQEFLERLHASEGASHEAHRLDRPRRLLGASWPAAARTLPPAPPRCR